MSNEAVNLFRKAAEAAGLPPGNRFVLWVLADRGTDHSGEDWTCFPSIRQLMKDTGFSRSAVEGHLRALDKAGFVSRDQRTRADGGKGVYDFTLHRCPMVRARLRWERLSAAERAAAEAGGEAPPPSDSTHGACPDPEGPTLRIWPPPPSESEGLEPSENPQVEPSLRARAKPEPGDQGVEAALAMWPASGLERTDWPATREAWARICDAVPAGELLAAVGECVASGTLERGDHGAPGLHNWLNGERWKPWLAKVRARAVGGGAGGSGANGVRGWAGPAEVFAAVAGALSGATAHACLDKSGWDGERRAILANSTWSRDQLARPAAARALGALTPPVTVDPPAASPPGATP